VASDRRPPNVVLIVADDLGYGDCGCFGSTRIPTPRIDDLAARGVRFTDFHSNGPVCSPTRAALLTGRYQQRCGIEGVLTADGHRDVGLAADEATFAAVLRETGYATGCFGKWHLGYAPEYNPIHRGFDEFHGFVAGNVDYRSHVDQSGREDWWTADQLRDEEGYTTDLVTAHGLRFIAEHRDRPFCLYLAHECPHYPYQGPDDPAYRKVGDPGPPHGPRDDQDVAYVEMMAAMDAGIGKIVDAIADAGLAEDTLIFFFSDNGPTGPGSAGELRGGKGTLWEGGHRVPAAALWPGAIPAGTVCAAPCLGLDLFATFCAAAGIAPPSQRPLDGIDLLPAMRGEDLGAERTLFWRYGARKAVRRGRWKLVVGEDHDDRPSLFDLDADLGETRDLAAAEPSIAADLTARLGAWEAGIAPVPRLS